MMDFGQALRALKEGKRVARKGWNGVGMWLKLQKPDENSKMTLPYVYIEYPVNPKHHAYPNGSRCPWLASQTDMLSEDWFILEEPKSEEKVSADKAKTVNKPDKKDDKFFEFMKDLIDEISEGDVQVHVIRVRN